MKIKGFKIFEYTFLIVSALIFLLMFWFFRFSPSHRILLTGTVSVLYAVWGIIHHAIEDRLTLAIALEYFLIASFVFMLVFTALGV